MLSRVWILTAPNLNPNCPIQLAVWREHFCSKDAPCCTTQVIKRKSGTRKPQHALLLFHGICTHSRAKCVGSASFVSGTMKNITSAAMCGRTQAKLPSARWWCQNKFKIFFQLLQIRGGLSPLRLNLLLPPSQVLGRALRVCGSSFRTLGAALITSLHRGFADCN